MSKHNRERRRKHLSLVKVNGKPTAVLLGGTVLSEEAMARVASLKANPGQLHYVGIFHDHHCMAALRAGAKKCVCVPDVKMLTADSLDPAVQRARREEGLDFETRN